MKKILFLALSSIFLLIDPAYSQDYKVNRVKIFLDCSNVWCDETYIRSEINLVDFVTDRIAADVHLLITSQPLGNGGRQFQLIFYGQKIFSNQTDTLRFNLQPDFTDSEERENLLKYTKVGLVNYISMSDMIHHMNIHLKRDDTSTLTDDKSKEESDKWNYWVYRVGSNGSLNLDQNYKTTNISGNVSANRTTDQMKLLFRYGYGKNKSEFEYTAGDDTFSFVVENTNWNAYNLFAWSLSDHWSAGYTLSVRNSTFSNLELSTTLSPIIEYNIFPYQEVNNKYLSFSYGIDLKRNNYFEETLFDKTEEWLFGHTVRMHTSFNQKWGSLSGTVTYTNYFHDWDKNGLNIYMFADVRITGGLSFYVNLFGGLTRNQLFISKGDASVEEVLARRRQLASNYNYGTWFGINYRFGSIMNNFVNPRFRGM